MSSRNRVKGCRRFQTELVNGCPGLDRRGASESRSRVRFQGFAQSGSNLGHLELFSLKKAKALDASGRPCRDGGGLLN